jgi:hypothetical protein
MTRTRNALAGTALLGLFAALAGCGAQTNVSAIGNVPGFYSHVYITAQAVWFNNSATAGPNDGGWAKFPLSTPVTVDLVADSNGNFGYLVNDLTLAPGTYSQVRLIPVDPSTPLTSSAQTAGAIYNCEADYIDAQGVTQQLPLELLNPDLGVGVQTSLTVPIGSVGAALAGSTTGTTGTTTGSPFETGDTSSPFASTTTTPTTGTGLPGIGSNSSTTSTLAQFALAIDAARDLSAFNIGETTPTGTSITGVMWSSHATAYDLSKAGGVQGTLTLTNLTNISATSGVPQITVSAELLTTDNSRHYVVLSTPVASDGTFTLYPLAANSTLYTYYDLVIHGPGIATIIIKNVQIPPYNPSSCTSLTCFEDGQSGETTTGTGTSSLLNESATTTDTTTNTTLGTTTTNPLTGTTTTIPANLQPVQPQNLVSIGTLIPRQSTSFSANITPPSSQPLPAGAAVGFYQTLDGASEAPYVIESSPVDPINLNLAIPQNLSTGTIDSGTYVESGSTVTVTSTAPREGAGAYQVAAFAPLYNNGTLGTEVKAPAASSSSASTTTAAPAQVVMISPISLASGGTPATLTAVVKGGRNNQGELLVSNNGQLVASKSLDGVLPGGGTVQLTNLPGGTSSSLYYVTVRTWSSSNPTGTVTRQWFDTPVDLRSASSASIQLTLN